MGSCLDEAVNDRLLVLDRHVAGAVVLRRPLRVAGLDVVLGHGEVEVLRELAEVLYDATDVVATRPAAFGIGDDMPHHRQPLDRQEVLADLEDNRVFCHGVRLRARATPLQRCSPYTERMEAYVHDAVLDMHHGRDELEGALAEIGADDWSRKIPYGSRTLKELLAHLAGADQAWAVAAQGLLKGEAEHKPPLTPEEAKAARARTIERGRNSSVDALLEEMRTRRRLLLTLYEELEQKHLMMTLPSYGEEHNSVRERIWLGYHDRMHAADIRRALKMSWEPPKLDFLLELREAVERLSPDETLYVIYSVDPTKWESPSVVPGWTNRNLLAHIASGDWVFQTHLRSLLDDGRAAVWPDVDAGNTRAHRRAQHDHDARARRRVPVDAPRDDAAAGADQAEAPARKG